MQTLTIDKIKSNGWLIYEVVAGSKAYGLNTAKSDTDIRGVFILPKDYYYGLHYVEQVNNETNDIVYYELKRFLELLAKNNPNIMEMLNIQDQFVLYKDELMNRLDPLMFMSKLCEKTYANYAYAQIKKAYGLEKKVMNPVAEKRKSVLDFCYIYQHTEAVTLFGYLSTNNFRQEKVGLTVLNHLRDCYNFYYNEDLPYQGLLSNDEANDVRLSSIPKGQHPIAMMYFNKDAYSVYCKKYKEYWDWVEKRNDERYKTTVSHGKGYDSKNMMHVFRLLLMAKEIATTNTINVYRQDREFLLSIKAGNFEYDDLVLKAEAMKNELPFLYQHSSLQDEPDLEKINCLLVDIRKEYYSR